MSTPIRVIHYVSLGDSVAGVTPSFVDILANRAGVALRGKVVVTRVVEENAVADLRARVKSTPALQAAIRSADLITVTLGANELARATFEMKANGCGSKDGSACVIRAEAALERSYDALLTELTQLRPARRAAYRLLTSYNIPDVFRGIRGTVFGAALRAENRYVCAQAPRRAMRCADVFTAFNGADGTRDPGVKGLTVPDGHPTAKGSTTIANVVLATGLAPLS